MLMLNIKKGNNMQHTYLSQAAITEALTKHAITAKEAKKLLKKLDSQASIFKAIHK